MPEFGKILADAKQFTETGHYEEALQRYLWFHNHAQEFNDPNPNAARLTSALSDWVELGRRYPKAKQALLEIRDEKTRRIAAGQGYLDLFLDVQAINHEWQDEDATYALFKRMVKTDQQLAGQCYFFVEGTLMQKGEYALCRNFLGDPQAHFEMIRSQLEMERNWQAQQNETRRRLEEMRQSKELPPAPGTPFRPPDFGRMATNNFVGRVCTLVEILVGTGDAAMAENIREEAVAVVEDARLKSAVSDAVASVKKHSPPTTPETK
jgi:hypothetical protein